MMHDREPAWLQVNQRKEQETLQHQQEAYIIKLENRLLAQHKVVQAAAAAEAVEVQTQAAGLPKRRAANRRSQGGAPGKPGRAASQQGAVQAQAEAGAAAAEDGGSKQAPSTQQGVRQATACKAAGASAQKGQAETGMQKERAGGVQEGGSEQHRKVQPAPEDFGELWASDGNASGSGNASSCEQAPRGPRGRQPTPQTPRGRRPNGGSRGRRRSPQPAHFARHLGSLAAEPLSPRQEGSRAASQSGSRSASRGRDLPAHPLFSPRSLGAFAEAVAGGPCPIVACRQQLTFKPATDLQSSTSVGVSP